MFLDNKYTKWYNQIVNRGKERTNVQGYSERHHIIPRSMGGNDDPDNLVVLTAREHFLCHWLLTKMTTGGDKMRMCFSLHTFFHFNLRRKMDYFPKDYERHRIDISHAARLNSVGRGKKDVFTFLRVESGERFTGTRLEFRKHSGLDAGAVNWLVNYCLDPDDPKKIIAGWSIWIESHQMFSNEKYRPPSNLLKLGRQNCEHCGKNVSRGNYKRWHGDKCVAVDAEGHHERTRQVASINSY